MNDALTLILAWAAGLMLGALFFGGLWWTVHKAVSSSQPALWFFTSLLLRTGITLTGFYFVSAGHGDRLIACLVGFIIVRLVVLKLTRRASEVRHVAVKETGHAA